MPAETGILTYLGIKASAAIAALAGTLVSLIATKGMSPGMAIISLFSGFLTSVYVTPLVTNYMELSITSENGVAFLLGLLGMNIITGLISLSKSFSANPRKFISFIRNDKKDGE